MTELLEKAVRKLAELPPEEQDAVATILLRELALERRWAELYAKSEGLLENPAGRIDT
jgi:hypothetical protein